MLSLTEPQQASAKLAVLEIRWVEQEQEPGQVVHQPAPMKSVGQMQGLGRTQLIGYLHVTVERLLLAPENPAKQEP